VRGFSLGPGFPDVGSSTSAPPSSYPPSMARGPRGVVFADGVRPASGKAGPGGLFWKTRADDMAVKAVRELLRRNPGVPPERIGDGVMAATAQGAGQGLTRGPD